MSKYKQGDIVKIDGIEFVVLDIQSDFAMENKDGYNKLRQCGNRLFVLLKEPFGNVPFGKNNNDYSCSRLREEVQNWFDNFAEDFNKNKIYKRKIDLQTMDGRMNYGTMNCLASPLTFDEWRKYSQYIPECKKTYWLATGHRIGCYDTPTVMCVFPYEVLSFLSCTKSCGMRPAMWVSEELVDTPEKPNLSEYSTMALLRELAERGMRHG